MVFFTDFGLTEQQPVQLGFFNLVSDQPLITMDLHRFPYLSQTLYEILLTIISYISGNYY